MICGNQYNRPLAPAMSPNQHRLATHSRPFPSGARAGECAACADFSRASCSSSQCCSCRESQDASRGVSGSSQRPRPKGEWSARLRSAASSASPATVEWVVDAHQPAGQRSAGNRREGHCQHEGRDGAGAVCEPGSTATDRTSRPARSRLRRYRAAGAGRRRSCAECTKASAAAAIPHSPAHANTQRRMPIRCSSQRLGHWMRM